MNFENNRISLLLRIYHSGTGTLVWEMESGADWLTTDVQSGFCSADTNRVNVSVNLEGFGAGYYSSLA